MYTIYYTSDAKKDYKKINHSNLKEKILKLLDVIRADPFVKSPPYKKLRGAYIGMYSRRINLQHRLFYMVDEKERVIKVLRMWSHYRDN